MTSLRVRGVKSDRYVIGLDFGTLSARAIVVDVRSGREIASVVQQYAHGVIESALPKTKRSLPPDTALQDPQDYLAALFAAIPKLLQSARIQAGQVIGIGTDFTCCTILPTRVDGTPLCAEKKWRGNPHAWVKLWKHHAAQPEAHFINEIGAKRKEEFLNVYGGKYSSEWFFSKILETVRSAPAVYEAADRFIEAGDWIVWQLCGEEKRSISAAGFKAMRVYPGSDNECSFPSRAFFKTLHPKLEKVVEEKLSTHFYPLGSRAGGLTQKMARKTGLLPGTPVAVGNIDAHVAVPACTVTTPGKLVMILGTSTCHILVSERKQYVEGMCGVVEHGVIPGLWGYEAGQAGVGDVFAWYVDHAVPAYVHQRAKEAGLSVYALLEQQAAVLKPGQSGLLALDWWNGNRSVLVDADLTGLIVGLNLASRPHEIYRALIEATAFGTRKIVEAFTQSGVEIRELYACGGLALKNALLMQIYSDVTGMPIRVAAAEQASALGAAMQGAVAAGVYCDIHTAAKRMARLHKKIYRPRPAAKVIYDRLYAEYLRLHDAFGRLPDSSMKVLKQIRRETLK